MVVMAPAQGQEDPPLLANELARRAIGAEQTEDLVAEYVQRKRDIHNARNEITKKLLAASPAQGQNQRQILQEIEELRAKIAVWEKDLGDLALRAFCQNPEGNPEVAREGFRRLRGLMGEDVVGGQFNPSEALTLADRAVEFGSRNKNLLTIGCMAAYACCNFDACDRYLQLLSETGAPLSDAFISNLAAARQAWATENARREQDVNLPIAQIETNLGIIEVELYEDQAPHAVNQFITLAEEGFYNNRPFYFVKCGQVALTGCPIGDGQGNAGYYIPDERLADGARHHVVGSLSLIHDEPGRDSSQFAISYQCTPDRDGKYTVFGRVINGLNVLFSLPHYNSLTRATRQPDRIISVRITRKRAHPYQVLEKIEIKNTSR